MLSYRLIFISFVIVTLAGTALFFKTQMRTQAPANHARKTELPIPRQTVAAVPSRQEQPLTPPLAPASPEPEKSLVKAWEKTFGGSKTAYFNQAWAHADGRITLAGHIESGDSGGDVWLMQLSNNGEKMWERSYGGKDFEESYALIGMPPDRMLLVGTTESIGQGKTDGWVMALDGQGKKLWDRTYGGKEQDFLRHALILPDGDMLFAGETLSTQSKSREGWLVRTDRQGKPRWQRTFGGAQYIHFNYLVEMQNNTYAVIGYGQNDKAKDMDGLLILVNGEGEVLRKNYYGGAHEDSLQSGARSQDGGLLLVGYTHSKGAGDSDGWLLKVDAQADLVWDKTYGAGQRDAFQHLTAIAANSYLIAGDSQSGPSSDGWVLIVDGHGDTRMESRFGGPKADWFRHAVWTDSGVFFAGSRQSDNGKQTHGWLQKLHVP